MDDEVAFFRFLSDLLGVDVFVLYGAVVGVAAISALAVAILVRKHRNRRSTALRAVAESLGLSFSASERRVRSGHDPLLTLHLFSKGRSHQISNLMWGKINGVPARILDCRFQRGGGETSQTWRQSVVVFESARLCLPQFALRPETGFHKIGSVFGYQDIDFPSHPVFSKRYLLQGGDEAAIRGAFTDEVLRYYEDNPELSTEAAGHLLVHYRLMDLCPPDEMRLLLDEAFEVFALFARASCDVRAQRKALLGAYNRRSRLKARVSFDGVRFRLANLDAFPWQHLCLNVNATRAGGGYFFEPGELPPGRTLRIPATAFQKLDGTRLDPAKARPRSLYVFCENRSGDLLEHGIRFK